MTHAETLEVRNGEWAHVPVGDDADDRSAEQQTRDRLLRDLALAIHYDWVMPTQGVDVPDRDGDLEPYAAQRDGDSEQTAAVLREIQALLGAQAVVELRAAAIRLAETKPGQ
jgi:hypothetical protein